MVQESRSEISLRGTGIFTRGAKVTIRRGLRVSSLVGVMAKTPFRRSSSILKLGLPFFTNFY